MSVAFADLQLPEPIARAIAARGYETATAVQAAVRDAALANRDLLVSSRTGSGKTLAFGTLIADALLRARAERGERERGAGPRALVVAPTRELAAQVGRELAWLFAEARVSIGTFTGGTSLGPDLRALRTGVEVAVGTPGRLVDLLEREALDLSGVVSLVLDEADEMLSLGFKEDLERLLGQSPPERRTLLFSATLPPEIQRLAKTYLREPSRVDVREGASGKAHEDIAFVAHLIHGEDRLAAVVNVLLAAGDAKAIVFCRTRDRVAALQRHLADLALRAEAIAGDRAQAERERALEALRSGRVRILVATDVAARGLDLPDVDLVVHGDLPDSVETLAHRSGRTGRAGRKGTTVVIAEMRERRKAERLLAGVSAPARFTPPPGPADIRRQSEERLFEELLQSARRGEDDGEEEHPAKDAEAGGLADRLRAAMPERALLSLLLERELARVPRGLDVTPVRLAPAKERRPHDGGGREDRFARERPVRDGEGRGALPPRRNAGGAFGGPEGPVAIFRVSLGRNAGAEPARLLPLICERGGVTRTEVGAIRIGAESTTFEISADVAERFGRAAAEGNEADARFELVRPAGPSGKPAFAKPSHAGGKPPFGKGKPAGGKFASERPAYAGGKPPFGKGKPPLDKGKPPFDKGKLGGGKPFSPRAKSGPERAGSSRSSRPGKPPRS